MHRSLIYGAALAVLGSLAAAQNGTEPTVVSDADLAAIVSLVAMADENASRIDDLIVAQEAKLDALYDRRDAAAQDDRNDVVGRMDELIDRMTLTLTALEEERDNVRRLSASLNEQLRMLRDTDAHSLKE